MGAGLMELTYKGKPRTTSKPIIIKKYKKVYKKKSLTSQLNKLGITKPEKKRIQGTLSGDNAMGQSFGDVSGYLSYDITPQCTQGSNINNRIGNKISLTGIYFSVQLRQMINATGPVRVDLYIIKLYGDNDVSAVDLTRLIFTKNDFISGGDVWDIYSQKNIDYAKNYQIIRRKRMYIKPDQFTGQQMPTQLTFGHKFKEPHVVRYSGTSASGFDSGRLIMMAFSSNGNASAVTASSLVGTPTIGVSTGQLLSYSIRYFFTDS